MLGFGTLTQWPTAAISAGRNHAQVPSTAERLLVALPLPSRALVHILRTDGMINDPPLNFPDKRIADVFEYSYDFTPALAEDEVISTLVVTSDDALLVIEEPTWIADNTAQFWISGGTAPNAGHKLRLSITTDQNRTVNIDVGLALKE